MIRQRGIAPQIVGSLRAAGLLVRPTELNLIEAYCASDAVADALIETLRSLSAGVDALPRVDEILRLTGEAYLRGEQGAALPLYAPDPDLLANRDALRSANLAYRDAMNRGNQRLHAEARIKLQPLLKKFEVKPMWSEFRLFLDYWWRTDTRHIFAAQTWRDVGLPEPYRPEVLEDVASWKLISDADAIALYQGGLAFDQPKWVQRMDQVQLAYLGGSERGVLVTRDGPFATVAKTVVHERYLLSRVMSLDEFLSSSGI